MPTVAELQRLDALVRTLTPLTRVQAGALIRAQDWNAVVGALIEVARAILAEAKEPVVPHHEHAEQVTLGWLDPRLRGLLERGPLADPAAAARLSDFDRRVTRLGAQLTGLEEGVGEVRNRVTEVATRDLAREREVTEVRRLVDGLADGRDDVAALRDTLRAVQGDLATALEVGRRLTVEGQPVDMADLVQRLRGVEELRERLRTPAGQLLDANLLEQRLTELTTSLVTEEELNQALEIRPGRIPPEDVAALRESLRAELGSGLEVSMTRVADTLRGEVTARLAEVDAQVSRAVSDALPGLRGSLLADVRPEISQAVSRGGEETRTLLSRQLDEREATLRGDLGRQLFDLQASIPATVRAEFDRQLPARLGQIRQEMDALAQRTAATETRLTDQDARMAGITSRLDSVERGNRTMIQELDARLTTTIRDVQARLDAMPAELRQQLATEVRGIAQEAAREEVRVLGDQLRVEVRNQITTDVRTATRAELAPVQTQLRQEMNSMIDDRLGPRPTRPRRPR
jgi:hypothetical protein